MSVKKKLTWSLVSIVLAVMTINVVLKQSKTLSLTRIAVILRTASPIWLILAALCMVAYIYLESAALLCLLKGIGYPRRTREGILYSASDIYFSAITPSATGGQPASAAFMMLDGIPGTVVTITLLINLVLYTLSILCIGLLCTILRPMIFLHFEVFSKALIIIGFAALIGLSALFLLLLFKQQLLHRVGWSLINLGKGIRLIRTPLKLKRRLSLAMRNFAACREALAKQHALLAKAFLYNLLQRLSQILVTVAIYMATGGSASKMLDVWAVQSYVVLGSNCVPIPGAMGISDYLLIDGFRGMLGHGTAIELELLSRSVSFYLCVLICLIITAIGYFKRKRQRFS